MAKKQKDVICHCKRVEVGKSYAIGEGCICSVNGRKFSASAIIRKKRK